MQLGIEWPVSPMLAKAVPEVPDPDGKGGFGPRVELLRFPQDSIIIGLEFRGDPDALRLFRDAGASVDGERRPIQELDAVRAVRAGAGRHVIEFRYRPASVYWGFGLTMLGFSIAALLRWRARAPAPKISAAARHSAAARTNVIKWLFSNGIFICSHPSKYLKL